MSQDPIRPQPTESLPQDPRIKGWQIWIGLVLFGGLDFFAFFIALDRTRVAAFFVIAVPTIVLAGLLAFKVRGISIGILGGYVVMTIVSGGACTLTARDPMEEGGAFVGLLLYPLIVLVFGVVAVIVHFVRKRQDPAEPKT